MTPIKFFQKHHKIDIIISSSQETQLKFSKFFSNFHSQQETKIYSKSDHLLIKAPLLNIHSPCITETIMVSLLGEDIGVALAGSFLNCATLDHSDALMWRHVNLNTLNMNVSSKVITWNGCWSVPLCSPV